MAFDPDKYLQKSDASSGFDPDAYLAASPKAEKPSRAGQAALESFGNTALMGYLPHAQALAGKAMPNPTAELDKKLLKEGFTISQPEQTYIGERDSNIKRQADLKESHPVASAAGTAAGIGATVVLGGAALKGAKAAATAGGRAAQAAKAGAAYGAIQNPGDIEGDVSGLQLKERGKNAAIGAAVGALAQGGTEAIAKGGKITADWLRAKAAEKAFRSLGPGKKAFELAKAKGMDADVGRTLLDEGAIPVLGTPGRIAKRVDSMKDKAGEQIKSLVRLSGDRPVVDGTEIALQVMDDPVIAGLRKTPGMEGIADKVDKMLETVANNGNLTLSEAQTLRQAVDKSINFGKQIPEMKGTQEALYKVRTAIRDKMNAVINALENSPGKDALLKANKRYSGLAEADTILGKKIAGDASNRSIGLTDTIMMASGASQGPGLGLALGAANKLGRTFGTSMQARAADAASKILSKSPKLAEMATQNPKQYQILVNRLASVVNAPKFEAEQIDPLLENDDVLTIFKQNPALIDQVMDEKLREDIKRKIASQPEPTAVDRKLEEARKRDQERMKLKKAR